MKEIIKCTKDDYATLAEIWERSVRATHRFLTENDIIEIKSALTPFYFPRVELYTVKDNDALTGFIGINGDRIEMLFIDSAFIGYGHGSMLIDHAKNKGCRLVDVNEQNPDALNFYIRNGFRVVGRDAKDENGRPFPILHLSL